MKKYEKMLSKKISHTVEKLDGILHFASEKFRAI